MKEVYLLIGGNIGDRAFFLKEASRQINAQCGQLIMRSSIYETAAWGKEDQAAFLNQVLVIKSMLAPDALLNTILRIEQGMGRMRRERNGERNIDIDILYIEDEVIELPELKIPHPRIYMRKFALIPLAELNHCKVDPISKKTIQQLLEECPDQLEVKKYRLDLPDNLTDEIRLEHQ